LQECFDAVSQRGVIVIADPGFKEIPEDYQRIESGFSL
jgi:hypothetical protein